MLVLGGAAGSRPSGLWDALKRVTQNGYDWSEGSMVIHLSSVNSLITARPSKRP